MPTNRKRTTRKRKQGPVAGWKAQYLLTGELPSDDTPDFNPFDGLDFDDRPRKGISHAHELWDTKRDELLAYWVGKHPGTRPFAWWKFDAKEYRKRIGGLGQPAHEIINVAPAYRYGVPAMRGNTDDPPTFESQAKYLERTGLLTLEEYNQLTAQDYRPEVIPC